MQTTVSAWLMATLTPSALMVALVQTWRTAPALLFGIAAGALADIVDRRRIILSTQVVLIAVTALLGIAELAGYIGPAALLACTFLIGAGVRDLPAGAAGERQRPRHAQRAAARGVAGRGRVQRRARPGSGARGRHRRRGRARASR